MGGGSAGGRRQRSVPRSRVRCAAAAITCGGLAQPSPLPPCAPTLAPLPQPPGRKFRGQEPTSCLPSAAPRHLPSSSPSSSSARTGWLRGCRSCGRAGGRPRLAAIKWLVKEMQVSGRSSGSCARRGGECTARPGPPCAACLPAASGAGRGERADTAPPAGDAPPPPAPPAPPSPSPTLARCRSPPSFLSLALSLPASSERVVGIYPLCSSPVPKQILGRRSLGRALKIDGRKNKTKQKS